MNPREEFSVEPNAGFPEGASDPGEERCATEADIRELLAELGATGIVDILLLQPSFSELEEAVLWSRGDAYLLGRKTLDGKAKTIFDYLNRKSPSA